MQYRLSALFDKYFGSIARLFGEVRSEAEKVDEDDTDLRIWDKNFYRLFITHKSEDRVAVSALKEGLRKYGISAFVAHEDIHPTLEWQNEIEIALASMDGLLAYMTPDFHDSDWTDQELGFAFGRKRPIIAMRLGKDPYGFIGKFQALSCDSSQAPLEIVKLLIHKDGMLDAYIHAVENCQSFDDGNSLANVLPCIRELSLQQVEKLVAAYKSNIELQGSFGFNGTRSSFYGTGLAGHLARITGKSIIELGLS